MKRFQVVAILLVNAVGLVNAASSEPGPEVLVVSDVFSDAPGLLRPSPGKPIYYIIAGKMERTLGKKVAGEAIPSPAAVEQAVVGALARRGFIRTQVGGPIPMLAIIINWGTAKLVEDQLYSSDTPLGDSSSTEIFYNQDEIAQLVGADKADRQQTMRNETDQISRAARETRGYIFIGAFDALALANRQKKLLWRTRISVETRHYSLRDSLAVMLSSAALFFGADTNLPVFVGDAERRKASVDIGALTVVRDVGANASPNAEPTHAPK